MAINENLKKVFVKVFDLAMDEINIDLTQNDIPKWDSLAQMELVVTLEKTFSINLKLEEISIMTSVKTITNILQKKGVDIFC